MWALGCITCIRGQRKPGRGITQPIVRHFDQPCREQQPKNASPAWIPRPGFSGSRLTNHASLLGNPRGFIVGVSGQEIHDDPWSRCFPWITKISGSPLKSCIIDGVKTGLPDRFWWGRTSLFNCCDIDDDAVSSDIMLSHFTTPNCE